MNNVSGRHIWQPVADVTRAENTPGSPALRR
jgi:hypothetical protein